MRGPIPQDPTKRFLAKVSPEPNTGCWLWVGNTTLSGYGQFRVGSLRDSSRRYEMAHRFAYTALRGAIPSGLDLDHLCRQPLCVNPLHLEPVTRGENIRRGHVGDRRLNPGAVHNRRKTHCRNGHPYADENLSITAAGHRVCRECSRESSRRYLIAKGRSA